jgi:hypothetical protein
VRIIGDGAARWATFARMKALGLGMKSSTKKRLFHGRAALHAVTFAVLTWNLASLGALVNGREAFARTLEESPVPASVRLGLTCALLGASLVTEAGLVRMGALSYRSRGVARLQLAAGLVVALAAAAMFVVTPPADGDLRVLHEGSRRALGTPWAAAIPLVGLGALALFAFQSVEASGGEARGKLLALAGFAAAVVIFALGLRALVPLLSGAPILPH